MFKKLLDPIAGFICFCFLTIAMVQAAWSMPGAKSPASVRSFSGEVTETMNASGYTYMLITNGDKQTWVAIPETTIEKGSVVSYLEGMVMENFVSKTLNKTFPTIVFSAGLAQQEAQSPHKPAAKNSAEDSFAAALQAEGAMKPGPVTQVGQEMSGGSTAAIVPFEELSVPKSIASNGYSVEEIFNKAKDLSGKKVQVKAKVVKFSPMIMGTNWVHVQDGTGNPMHNSHDLVITTNDTVEVGTVVILEGTVSANKDFGAGYKYAAIVEQAALVK